jgi:hypothetical protein
MSPEAKFSWLTAAVAVALFGLIVLSLDRITPRDENGAMLAITSGQGDRKGVRAFACMVLAVVSVNPGDRLRWTQNFPDSCSVQGSFGEMICVNPFSSSPFSPRWERLPFPRRPNHRRAIPGV